MLNISALMILVIILKLNELLGTFGMGLVGSVILGLVLP
jgi:hypothetical protein